MKITTWDIDSLDMPLPHILGRRNEHRSGVLAPGRDSACPASGTLEGCCPDEEAPL